MASPLTNANFLVDDRGLHPFDFEPVKAQVRFCYDNPGKGLGIPTGYPLLDYVFGGLKPSEYIVVAARPSVGKTALVLNIALNVAQSHNDDGSSRFVYVFSQEMSEKQLLWRLAGTVSGIPTKAIETGQRMVDGAFVPTTEQDYKAFALAARFISTLPLRIYDVALTTDRMAELIGANMADGERPALVISDYLQLHTDAGDDEVQRLTNISRKHKLMANYFDVPLIGVSQLSRAVESRDDKMPQMSDLRGSGSIEQDADCIMFLRRSDHQIYEEVGASQRDLVKVDVNVAKDRLGGDTGVLGLGFQKSITKFVDWKK